MPHVVQVTEHLCHMLCRLQSIDVTCCAGGSGCGQVPGCRVWRAPSGNDLRPPVLVHHQVHQLGQGGGAHHHIRPGLHVLPAGRDVPLLRHCQVRDSSTTVNHDHL